MLILYAYIIYPITIFIIGLVNKKKLISLNDNYPYVTIIIAAFNEEKQIKRKIENTLSIIYPKDNIQIIVSSDGSTDKTNEIVEKFREEKVELLTIPQRRGKENAQREALKLAKGEIIVFTDVATMLDPRGVKQIVSNFADPTIGCVSSEDRVIGKYGQQSGENFYVRYEMWLRKLESKASSPIGLSGSFFAARKLVCKDFSENMDSDFRILLNTVKMGLRGTCDPMAIGYYYDLSNQSLEFERKVRTVLRGLTLFFQNKEFLNVFRFGLFSYQYFCHKLLRWLVPLFLILAFITNAFLAVNSFIFFILCIGQLVFYSLIVITRYYDAYNSSYKIIKIPVYFIIVNASIVVAWWRYCRKDKMTMWIPSAR